MSGTQMELAEAMRLLGEQGAIRDEANRVIARALLDIGKQSGMEDAAQDVALQWLTRTRPLFPTESAEKYSRTCVTRQHARLESRKAKEVFAGVERVVEESVFAEPEEVAPLLESMNAADSPTEVIRDYVLREVAPRCGRSDMVRNITASVRATYQLELGITRRMLLFFALGILAELSQIKKLRARWHKRDERARDYLLRFLAGLDPDDPVTANAVIIRRYVARVMRTRKPASSPTRTSRQVC